MELSGNNDDIVMFGQKIPFLPVELTVFIWYLPRKAIMDPVTQLHQIWDSFAFTRLLRTFRMSVSPAKLLIAMMAIVLITAFGWLMDSVTVATQNTLSGKKTMMPGADSIAEYGTPAQWPIFKEKALTFRVLEGFSETRGVFATLWNITTARFHAAVISFVTLKPFDGLDNLWLCVTSLHWAIKFHPIYSVIFLTFVIVVMSFSGGAICRLAALEFARGEKPGLTEAMKFSWQKLGGFITAPAIPITIMVVAGAFIVILGLAGNIPVAGKFIMALGIPVGLVIGLIISLFLVGTIIGFNIMTPAIAYEGSNGFDAISRSFAYVFAHPWAVTFYGILASIYGAVSYLFVRSFAFLLLLITYTLVNIGLNNDGNGAMLEKIWAKPEFFNLLRENPDLSLTKMELATSLIINTSILTVVALLIAFVFSFYYCSWTIIYALMREKVDKTPSDQIYIHLDQVRD
ncbi:MAG: hypothetical protein K9M75_03650 [Phycisphaerae bacterium]|nr:hypothetical protein [Phycisphaerae bacterium]